MPKLTHKVLFGRVVNGRVELKNAQSLKAKLKEWPGTIYDAATGYYWVDEGLMNEVRQLCSAAGMVCEISNNLLEGPSTLAVPAGPALNSALWPYQRDTVLAVLRDRRRLICYDMGLGKTLAAIECARVSGAKKILIVCPAVVRNVWADELSKWWPEHGEVLSISSTKGLRKEEAGEGLDRFDIFVTSYELVQHLIEMPWDMLIFDEVHYVKNATCRRGSACKALMQRNSSAIGLGLTGTPVMNRPRDLYAQINLLWRGRFGDEWQYLNRYCEVTRGTFGTSVGGLNVSHSPELVNRLAAMSDRVTKGDVAHLLPPLRMQVLRRAPKKPQNFRAFMDSFKLLKQIRADTVEKHMLKAGSEKVDFALEVLELHRDAGETHGCIVTYFRATAEAIAGRIQELGVYETVVCVDGNTPADKRLEKIRCVGESTSGIAVVTMKSIGIGVDLTMFVDPIFAEMYYAPGIVSQCFMRFHRMNSKYPVTITTLVLDGSLDEVLIHSLQEKMGDICTLEMGGDSEEKLGAALAGEEQSEEEILDALQSVAMSMVSEDEYI